jgi:hypothetical protein
MFRALLIKEWRQLRMLRWVGFGLGILIPPFLIAAADAAQRGWLPFGRVGSYSVAELLDTAMPALLIGLWALLALLMTAQSFAADRAAGTEQFLLERPVPRARIWSARIVAPLASVLVLYLCHLAYWAGLTRLVAGPSGVPLKEAIPVIASVGAAVLLVAFVAGVAASTLLPVPIPAVLLGLVLLFVPGVLASVLGGLFPLAAFFAVPIGAVLPWLLLVAYLLASYRMHCRGEPAGRGRLQRGLLVLGVSLPLVPLLFLVLAPISVRAGAARLGWPLLDVPRGGEVKAIGLINETWPRCGWLIDVDRGRKLRLLPPPVDRIAWTDDGERVAVAHFAGPLGRVESRMKLDIFKADGERVGQTLMLDEFIGWIKDLRWYGEKLLLAVYKTEAKSVGAIVVLDPRDNGMRTVPVAGQAYNWELIGPDDEGAIYVFRVVDPGPPPRYALHRLDVERGELDPEPLLEEEGFPTYAGKWISPSGRYWLRVGGRPPATALRITDLESGEARTYPECLRGAWLAGDRFVCLESGADAKRLTVGRPGEARDEVFSRPGADLIFEIAPDKRRILVQVWKAYSSEEESGEVIWTQGQFWRTGAELREVLVLEPGSPLSIDVGRRIDLEGQPPSFRLRWVGSETLSASAQGQLAFLDLAGDEGPRYVFGSP